MNREQQIKEARTIEAMRHGYMGMEGKFALIVRRLGEPIIHQGSVSYEQNFLPDPFDLKDENKLPTIDSDESSYEIGYMFDGLPRGVNMSIFMYSYNREIVCEFEGRKVYREVNGELEAYVPESLWEGRIQSLFEAAKKVERKAKPVERQKLITEANKKRKELLDGFKNRWGLT